MANPSRRPRFLDVTRIRFPVGAICSFGHRVSGVALAIASPLLAVLFTRSLQGAEGYAEAANWLTPLPVRAALVLVVWALAHHLLAGVRHLLMDVGFGSALGTARASAWLVNLAGVAIAALAVGALR
ncbi:MAG: succinate dehydrogenase, cytochrome b556 subunit [Betaproteobacteria bacterium]|jgi:succinate dehydrogenase / fumarate reductase cytochrome b subunit|nr:MAG: succinate dehydrogenase, cytochrome b556 subunit [Betaproteobacteria bacterium]